MTVQEPSICSGCGILVAAGCSRCAACQTPYPSSPPRALPQPGGGYWVAIRARFVCNACRFESPLNHFPLGDGVVCLRCGLEQRYDHSEWRELCDFAHQVGDLGSGGPEGRFPDPDLRILGAGAFPELASGSSWVSERRWQASPGNPLCRQCHAPLVVTARSDGGLEVMCSGCGERRSYELPPAARALKRLAGVLCDEHDAGGREVKLDEQTGVVVVRCPACDAPLENVDDGDGVVVCAYCQAPCRISAESHARAGHKSAPAKTWWLYFDQPSAERRKRLNEARQGAAKAAKQRARAADRARSQAGQATGSPPRARESAKARAKRAELKALKPLLWTMAAVPLVVLLVYLQPFAGKKTDGGTKGGRPSASLLQRFSFKLAPSQVADLFGTKTSPDVTIELQQPGVVNQVRILRGSGGPSYSIHLQGGERLDLDAVLARLRKLAPHRLRKAAAMYEVSAAKTLLRFDPRVFPRYRGAIQISTWVKEDARAVALADAFWAAARYAVFGGDRPTAAELRMLNGPPLSAAATLDLAVPIESATNAFRHVFPDGSCRTRTDLLSKKSELYCEAEVDHPWVDKLQLAWPNGANTTVERAVFSFGSNAEAGRLAGDCLDRALGKGKAVVVDHATGQSNRSWQLDRAGGQATLDPHGLGLTAPEGRDPKKPTAWVARFSAVAGALDGCAR